MTGDTLLLDGIEYQVIWSGEEGLIPERQTKVVGGWEPPRRLYNKTGRHTKKVVDNPSSSLDTSIILGEINGRRTTGTIDEIV